MDIASNDSFDSAIGIAEGNIFDSVVLTALVLNGAEDTCMIEGNSEII